MALAASNRRKTEVDTSYGPWWYWEETNRAERAIRFIETYCRNPKGYGYGETIVLNDEQKEWFREILNPEVSMAIKSCMRGEGKSTEVACLAIWRAFDKNESGAGQIPIIATTVSQAERSVYTVVLQIVRAEPELATRSIEYGARGSQKLMVPSTSSEIFPMANDVDGLQGLDPLLAIMDEIGFQSQESWDAVLLASGKRPDSLVLGVGTPGFNRNNALWAIRQAYKENGPTAGFRYLEIAAPEGCDYKSEDVWYAASPALRSGFKNINAMRTAVGITPESHFRIFYLGQWVEGTDSWLGNAGRNIWDAGESDYEFVENEPMWLGLDVGITSDSSALVRIQERKDIKDKLICDADIWLPAENGGRVDITDIQQRIRDLCSLYDVRGIYYDPRLFEIAGDQLKDEGYPMVRTPQSWETMSPAYLELYRAIHDGMFTHTRNDRFRTQILNGVGRYNERGFVVSKERSNGKIDGTVGLCLSFRGYVNRVAPKPPLCIR